MKHYLVNEIFGPTIQGEGVRAGTVNWWLRFAACNLTCRAEVEGFDCDTDFSGGTKMTAEEIVAALDELRPSRREGGARVRPNAWVVVSGGEPGLQLDAGLIESLREANWRVAVETNGTRALPSGLDWISCSPKTAEHTLRVGDVDELRYVRAAGQALPKPTLKAQHYIVSPAFEPDGTVLRETLNWCVKLVKENPSWRLSVQLHKLLGLR